MVAIDRPGTLWLDQTVLLDAPEDRYEGLPIRKDIAQAMLGSGITYLRYGGTMVNAPGYRWKSMIGDPDRRPPYAGHWYSCSTNGFGIFDFLRFCEKAKLRASFAINVDETPEDAADLAEYLTGPVTSPWGRRRAQDGHPTPYRVDSIEIGNEEAIGNPDAEALARYATRFRLLADAIHRKNPNLKLVCGAWWVPDSPAMKTVFDAIDGKAAAWDFHF
ncbi:alpha-L-arabinofuranosidase, partial [bacterium]